MTQTEVTEQADNRIYEVGFHIVSSIPEEKLPALVTIIRDLIEGNGGVVISEESPKLRPLSYTMTKVVGPKHLKFDTAYFGWIKFEIDPSAIAKIKTALLRNDNIIRSILVKTVRENTLSVIKPPMFKTDSKTAGTGEIPKNKENKAPVSEAELDKTIDALMVE